MQERANQPARSEWRKYDVRVLIDERALVIGDGYRAKNTELSKVGLPFARAGNIGNEFQFSGADCFPADELHKVGEKISQPGDTVFTSKGTVGRFAFVKNDTPRFVYSPQLSYWRSVRTDLIEPRFLYYWMSSEEFFSQFKSVSGQTDMAEYVSLRDQRRMYITLPPIPEQRTIAHVLGTLDDKIELTRRMNETQEEMARALFKSWFVDFDPVRAKTALKRSSHITPPLRGSRQAKGVSPQARRWGEIKRRYSPQTLRKARTLRQAGTDAEGLLWHFLRNKQLDDCKFRRQQPIGPYIADFACLSRKLLIELDGSQHAERHAYDEKRDAFLEEKGYRTLRFWNNEVFEHCFGVLERVYEALTSPPPHQLSPVGSASACLSCGRRQATPPRGGSDWTVERARTYLPAARGLAQAGLARMDDSIADLFPDRLVDSELGLIPEGWEFKSLSECIKVARGLSYKGSGLSSDGMPMHNLNSVYEGGGYKEEGIKYYNGNFKERHVTQPGDVLVANTEQGHDRLLIGFAAIIPERFGGRSLFSHHLYRIRPERVSGFSPDFVCQLLNTQAMHDNVSGYATGTTVNMLPRDALTIPGIVVPPPHLVATFSAIAQIARSKQEQCIEESRTLAAQRDELLSKLVSGQLRVGQ